MERIWKTIKLPLFVWTGLMIIGSSLPGDAIPSVVSFWEWDKVAHGAEFFVFSMLLFRYLHSYPEKTLSRVFLICLLIGIIYAGLDELHQLVIPNRECDWLDFMADSAGVLAGTAVAQTYYRKKAQKVILSPDKA
jgi:VanZ family protein